MKSFSELGMFMGQCVFTTGDLREESASTDMESAGWRVVVCVAHYTHST